MHSLCEELCIPHRGGQLERIFQTVKYAPRDDGTTQRNGKFDRHIKGLHSVAPSTIEQIKKFKGSSHSIKLYESSLWQALTPNEKNPDWLVFFQSLRPSLQSIALTNEPVSSQSIKKLTRYTALTLIREGDIEALACAIALHRCSPFSQWQNKAKLSTTIAKLLGWILADPAFKGFEKSIGNLVYNHYEVITADLSHYDPNFCTPKKFAPYFFIFELAAKNREYIDKARNLKLLRSTKDLDRLFTLSDKGDKQLILNEMKLTLIHRKPEITRVKKGLNWLISELNKFHKDKLDLF